jgi:hypothetical protein
MDDAKPNRETGKHKQARMLAGQERKRYLRAVQHSPARAKRFGKINKRGSLKKRPGARRIRQRIGNP